ncbi:MAG TPA: hypothetical protein VH560_05920 [Polyangia bacterium]|jgi:hypothetical protein|nr:hypothetical protein [Polyangia bacterium]
MVTLSVTISTRTRLTRLSSLAGAVAMLGMALAGCGDSTPTTEVDPADAFVGTWHYDQSTGAINCPMADVIAASPTGNKTFAPGATAALVDLTPSPVDPMTICNTYFDVAGPVATAHTDVGCTITGGDVVTIDAWTFSLTSATSAKEVASATLHITTAAVAPATTPTTTTCAFNSMALLTRVAKD